ncbi:MAG: hypothetical protein ACLFR1_09950 [Spirochaetia bacterium]
MKYSRFILILIIFLAFPFFIIGQSSETDESEPSSTLESEEAENESEAGTESESSQGPNDDTSSSDSESEGSIQADSSGAAVVSSPLLQNVTSITDFDFSNSRVSIAGPNEMYIRSITINGEEISLWLTNENQESNVWAIAEVEDTQEDYFAENVSLEFATIRMTEAGNLQFHGILVGGEFYSATFQVNSDYTLSQVGEYQKIEDTSTILTRLGITAGESEYTEEDVAQLTSRISDLQDRVSSLASEKEDLQEQIASLQAQLSQAQQQLQAAQSESAGESSSESSETEEPTEETQQEESDGESELLATIQTLQESNQELNETVETLETQNENLNDQISLLQDRIETLTAQKQELNNEIASLGSEIEELRQSTVNAEPGSELAALRETIQSLQEEIADLESRNAALSGQGSNIAIARAGTMETMRPAFTEVVHSGFEEAQVQMGIWELYDGIAEQTDPGQYFAKLLLPLEQETEPTLYSFDARADGEGWVGLGLHIFVNDHDRRAGWGLGDSLLVWLTRDPEVYGDELTYLQLYRSDNAILMERVMDAIIPEPINEYLHIEILYDPAEEYIAVAVNGEEKIRYRTWFSVEEGVQIGFRTLGPGIRFRDFEVRQLPESE